MRPLRVLATLLLAAVPGVGWVSPAVAEAVSHPPASDYTAQGVGADDRPQHDVVALIEATLPRTAADSAERYGHSYDFRSEFARPPPRASVSYVYDNPSNFFDAAGESSWTRRALSVPEVGGVAPQSAGARFVAGADGVVDTLGGNPNAIVLGKYPAYVNQGAATGPRTFSIADDAWNAMSPAEQWLRNQRFLDGAIARGSEIQLATRLTPSNLTGWFAREIEYLTKQGYVPNAGGTHMIPGG